MAKGNGFSTGSNLHTNQSTCGGNAKSGLPNTLGMTVTAALRAAIARRLAYQTGTAPGNPCTGAMFTAKLNQANAGGVGKIVLSRAYVTHSNTLSNTYTYPY